MRPIQLHPLSLLTGAAVAVFVLVSMGPVPSANRHQIEHEAPGGQVAR